MKIFIFLMRKIFQDSSLQRQIPLLTSSINLRQNNLLTQKLRSFMKTAQSLQLKNGLSAKISMSLMLILKIFMEKAQNLLFRFIKSFHRSIYLQNRLQMIQTV